jgi:hypothetical protein
VRGPKSCIAHARPHLVRSARPPGNQGHVTRRYGGAQQLLHSALGSMASEHRWSSHGDGGPGGMGGPRAPHERDAAVLRLEGQHPGMDTRRRTPTPPVLSREELKEEGKRKVAAVMLTSGRRCSRSRLEDGRWRGEVDVPGDVDVPAPVRLPPPTRTASSPSHERRLKTSSLACRRRPGASAPSPGSTRRRRVCSLSLTVWPLVKEGKPQWGSWLVRSGCSLTLPLNPGVAAVWAKAPICPGLDRPGGQGGAGFPRARQAVGRGAKGGKSEIPRARLGPCARTHRSLDVRAR